MVYGAIMDAGGRPTLAMVSTVCFAVLAASALHYLVEKPLSPRIRRRVGGTQGAVSSAAEA
jgi:peptidoglycan/LPS O-acetylase OafA/YrhL